MNTVVALLEKPSAKSFGMTGLIVKIDEIYQTSGLASGNRIVTPYELNYQLGGHILNVESSLPSNLMNPVALWLGTQFYSKATELGAPTLPIIDQNWHTPLQPEENRGNYTIKEPAEAYKILDDWVTETARESLVRDSHDLAVLTGWALPLHSATRAALYYTASNKSKELEWQSRTAGRKVSAEQLIQEHERVRKELLKRK